MDKSRLRKLFPTPLPPASSPHFTHWGCSGVGAGWWERFYLRVCKDTKLFCLSPPLHSSLFSFLPASHPANCPPPLFLAPCPSSLGLLLLTLQRFPGDLFCFRLCFCFCFECLSLQVSVAGRSPFRSQRLQCKLPFPLGKCTTLFGGDEGVGCFFLFLISVFFSFGFGGGGWKWERDGGRVWGFVYFFRYFQGWEEFFCFFLICVMNKIKMFFENGVQSFHCKNICLP